MTTESSPTPAEYLVTDADRTEVSRVLFGEDSERLSDNERYQRIADALYWNGAVRIAGRKRPALQSTVDLQTHEVRRRRSREETGAVLWDLLTEAKQRLREPTSEALATEAIDLDTP